MKKLLAILFVFLSLKSFGQPIVGRSGSSFTVMDSRSMSQYNLFLPRYADTTAANVQKGIDTLGAKIFTYNPQGEWLRVKDANGVKKWTQTSSSSGGVNIYNSNGTLTSNRTVTGAGYYLAFDGQSSIRLQPSGLNRTSLLYMDIDSFRLEPPFGILTIDSLASGASTDSVLVWTQATGRVKKRSYSAFTPTWQQTLTAGSTLTQNNDVSLGTTRLRFLGDGIGGGKFYAEQLREVYLQADNGTTPQLVHLMGAGDRIELSSTGTYETGLYTQHNVYSDTIPQITLYAGDVPSQVKNWLNPTAVRVRRNELAFVLNNARVNNFRIFAPERTSDTAWKAMAWNPADSTVKMFNNWQQLGITVPISSLTAATQTNSITVGHSQAWNYNGITSGIGHQFTSNSITSGSIFDITGTSTALASGNEGLNIAISGANGTNGIPVTGARISVTNTNATSGTNIGLEVTASGATTGNYAALFTGRVGIGTSTPTDQLHVATGAAVLNQISTHTTATSANLYTGSDGTANGASTTTPYLFGGASSVLFRVGINGASATNIPVNNSYATTVVASSVIGEEASGTHGFIGSAVFKPPTISSGVATVTNTSTVYITDAPSATVTGTNSSLWVGSGVTRFGTAGTSLGSFTLEGNISGVVTLQPAPAAGTYTLTLPTTDGNASEFLQTNGSGVLTWAAAGGGTPAGNFGNVQIGRNGAFDTPASDSLDFESATGLSVKGDVRTTTSLYLPSSSSEGLRFGGTVRMFDDGSKIRISPSAGTLQFFTSGSNADIYAYNSAGNSYIRIAPLSGTGSILESAGSATNLRMQTTSSHTLAIGNFAATTKLEVGGTFAAQQGADVASANNLAVIANSTEITGTTQINLIANTGWVNGSIINLVFTTTPLVKSGQATSGANITLILAGGVDFSATANDILTLMLCEVGGTQAWREVSRSVN